MRPKEEPQYIKNRKNTAARRERRKQQEYISDAADTFERVATEYIANAQQARSYQPKKDRREQRTLWAIIVTAALALGTVIVGLIQASISREQLASFDRESHIRLRAYVNVSAYGAFNVAEKSSPLQVYVTMRNSGQIVGQKVVGSIGLNVRASEADTFDGLGERKERSGVISLAPNTPIPLWAEFRELTADEAAAIRSPEGRLKIFVFGRVAYQDVFKEAHWTNYCYVFFGSEMGHLDGKSYEGWQAKPCEHPEYNASD